MYKRNLCRTLFHFYCDSLDFVMTNHDFEFALLFLYQNRSKKLLKPTFNGTFSVFSKTIGTYASQMTQVVYIVKPGKSHKITITNG